jgi:hypothetical protein
LYKWRASHAQSRNLTTTRSFPRRPRRTVKPPNPPKSPQP